MIQKTVRRLYFQNDKPSRYYSRDCLKTRKGNPVPSTRRLLSRHEDSEHIPHGAGLWPYNVGVKTRNGVEFYRLRQHNNSPLLFLLHRRWQVLRQAATTIPPAKTKTNYLAPFDYKGTREETTRMKNMLSLPGTKEDANRYFRLYDSNYTFRGGKIYLPEGIYILLLYCPPISNNALVI